MLTEQLSELLKTTQKLQNLLERERQELKEKTFKDLPMLLAEKQKVLNEMAQINQLISTQENLQKIEQDEALSALKASAEIQLKECKKNNEINGKLIEMNMKSNKHLRQLLTLEKGKNSVTYNQKGVLEAASLLGENLEA